ncbi:LPXTG cell wall anchor domain-containing protein [Micromonospora sp. LAH09]|uniref:LPXTG cell wall anchor domain-containing protein n=1 Tax=Micromonospora cabrerizensis TaxID=2911213 RepID=UPI001EE88324|nr:LPXTG cell wall anchor domain-containing protein [Micromonospora cabrerizensis]MCG5472966.1 LPXTG cell wall anchor domain-containing protein [Micromonospora cabrerizensis]
MRSKTLAGALIALAFLIPAAPAVAQTESPRLGAACQTDERKVYLDIRKLVTFDLDTANDGELRLLAYRILNEADAKEFPVLPDALRKRLEGTTDDLRAYLKTDVQKAWLTDLRVSVGRTMTDAGTNVMAAAQKVLDEAAVDAYLAYLNDGFYAARALDCASPTPSATPSVTPSATTTAVPTPTSSASLAAPGGEGGEGGGLPVTGANTATVAGIGGALLLLGGVGYLIGRRRRSSFVA